MRITCGYGLSQRAAGCGRAAASHEHYCSCQETCLAFNSATPPARQTRSGSPELATSIATLGGALGAALVTHEGVREPGGCNATSSAGWLGKPARRDFAETGRQMPLKGQAKDE